MVGLPGFEPGSFPCKAQGIALREPKSPSLSAIDWKAFENWLKSTHHANYVAKVVNYAKAWSFVLTEPKMASQIAGLSKGKRRNVMAALANLSKFLGVYKTWESIIADVGLHWQKTSHLETFLSILNTDLQDVKAWLLKAIEKLPKKYSAVLLFTAATGLRPDEACKSVSLVSELATAGRLETYLNKETNALEHFRFPGLFIRGSKNCYISFPPDDVLSLVLTEKPKVTVNGLRKALQKAGLEVRIKDLRKLFATTLRDRGISSEVVDLLEGRISQNIFLRHYYKPDLLRSIRDNVLAAAISLCPRKGKLFLPS